MSTGKQGLMVFFIHTGGMAPRRSSSALSQAREIFFNDDAYYKELLENYDLFFMTVEEGDNKIEVFRIGIINLVYKI